MDFVVFEYADGKQSFSKVEDVAIFPEGVVAFTHYKNGELDANGRGQVAEYRIGIVVKFVIGDMCYELDEEQIHDGDYEDKYVLFNHQVRPFNENITLVEDAVALEKAYYAELGLNDPRR